MQTSLASNISLAADTLAKPYGFGQDDIAAALGAPEIAKAQCADCARHGCPLALYMSVELDNIDTCNKASVELDDIDKWNRAPCNPSIITSCHKVSFSVLCEMCSPVTGVVPLQPHWQHASTWMYG
mmetsp:Transcript_26539/g.42542  ORF Transcript_26539/g.42542 Transcript_26539/m.42542 type:complete len:126 (+) Transcript_26539:63-440(+)|eukprot:CAMPEP_0169131544 /NCGR_PEP_ID=MMETSP1015-20121227/38303_1 /TAXON_ID=342587 /ORGANISM="Karlodinium micrum, Strain CCMP2283" /LENGTH=125 /DNA_ID=CAMNT_0009195811 /DNA_START=54 /DNA_END=431 /DNA_ORIENTATION=+